MSYTDASLAPKRSKPRKAFTVVLILVAVVIGSRFLETGSLQVLPSPEVEVSSGTVTLYRTESTEPVMIMTGDKASLQEGDEVESGPNCQATIKLGDNRTVELSQNTRVTLLDTDWNITERSNPAWIAVDEGQVTIRVSASKLVTLPLQLDTDTITLHAKDATFSCTVPDRDHSHIAVFSGQVKASMGRDQITVNGGQSLDAILGYPLETRTMTDAELASQPSEPPTQTTSTAFPIATTPTASAMSVMSAGDSSQGSTYTVQPGDTLFGIAQRYGIDWNMLWKANQSIVPSPEQLKAGQILVIPASE